MYRNKEDNFIKEGSSWSEPLRANATILFKTLNIKCGLTCERSNDNSVFRFSVTFSFCILSARLKSVIIRNVVLAASIKRIGKKLNEKKFRIWYCMPFVNK